MHLLQRYPHMTIKMHGRYGINRAWNTLPKEDRERIMQVKENEDFRVLCGYKLRDASANIQNETDTVFTRKVYNNTIVAVKSSSCRSGEPILWTVPPMARSYTVLEKSPWEVLAEAWKARRNGKPHNGQ